MSIEPVIVIGAGAASSITRYALTAECADSDATERPTAVIITEILFFITDPQRCDSGIANSYCIVRFIGVMGRALE
jgi:hypothetical protein